MDINENELKKISIRGRVAYGIACFERALIFYHCKNNVWIDVIKKLWDYTSIEYIDDWYYEMAEYIPDSCVQSGQWGKCLQFLMGNTCGNGSVPSAGQ